MASTPAKDPIIRIATADDLGGLCNLLRHGVDEFPVTKIDEVKALREVQRIIKDGLVLVVVQDGAIVASTALVACQWLFSQEVYLSDAWTFVHPNFRKSRAAKMLLKGIRDLARRTRIPTFVDVRTFDQADRKNRLYRRFFKAVGEKFYVYPEHQGA